MQRFEGEWANKDWVVRADAALVFIDDPDVRTQFLYRFDSQYLPAMLKATTSFDVWRVWEAFRHYLSTRATKRKAFSLSDEEAEAVIDTLASTLGLPRGDVT